MPLAAAATCSFGLTFRQAPVAPTDTREFSHMKNQTPFPSCAVRTRVPEYTQPETHACTGGSMTRSDKGLALLMT